MPLVKVDPHTGKQNAQESWSLNAHQRSNLDFFSSAGTPDIIKYLAASPSYCKRNVTTHRHDSDLVSVQIPTNAHGIKSEDQSPKHPTKWQDVLFFTG